jgi:hypothetical protein
MRYVLCFNGLSCFPNVRFTYLGKSHQSIVSRSASNLPVVKMIELAAAARLYLSATLVR